ncbi:MAG: ATP-binding protein [Deferribacteraceae bacterium]|jgi:anti-sigma regulatory factor (Ser/Thr protein kinase)|nr:ATP-binding protein [Deferribacteraceae bacterium]
MQTYTLEVATVRENMPIVMAFVEEQTEFIENKKIFQQLSLAIEELATNIFNYAYGDEEGRFTISITNDLEKREVIIEFKDSGIEFNPLLYEEADISEPISQRKIGGLGIMMAKKMTDKQSYSHKDGENIFTITKRY